ncbi:hypothetical protein R70199_06982 [Paraburkholderia domus]|nr:hypothetical protein R70199_06982 [Paraburkholderia domus]
MLQFFELGFDPAMPESDCDEAESILCAAVPYRRT